MPLILAAVVTLVLGGASVAQAVTVPALDAHTDLEFSLDGFTWTDAPDLALGSWGCDPAGGPGDSASPGGSAPPSVPAPPGASGGIPDVDPCAMLPGESVDRTYHVRNAADSGRTGRYAVGVGDFVVSESAEFAVRSSITGATAADSGTVMLYGAGTGQAGGSPARGAMVAALELGPGESARVVDEVSVPLDVPNSAQRQSVSPRMWVSFSDVDGLDRDGDGLPDTTENLIGTDPSDPLNRLPDVIAGQEYGPERFLPTPPEGTVLDVVTDTLPPGMRLEDGALTGTPTRADTYDIAFSVTMPGGATYTSVRRVVVHPASGGGSTDLPDIVWPVIVGGVIGVVIGVFGPALGSLAGPGSLAGSGSLADSVGGSTGSTSEGGSEGSASGVPATSTAPSPDRSHPDGPGASDGPNPPDGADNATDTRVTRPATDEGDPTGRVAESAVTPREGAPSDAWIRANSEVRGSLATTGVSGTELVLWALTAAAAGATLILFARRRRHDAPALAADPALAAAPPLAADPALDREG
ncbi:thrombospondin type 3 repeat-containing protein [Dietzia maris]|uniref:thrombospondin type 3 repeat-containing protein n=1 Tax=Dietzia maris TaxID=37915 RepID=UPI0037CA440D